MNKNKLIRILYPKRCPLCGNIVPIEQDYCLCSGNSYELVDNDFCEHCGSAKENCLCSLPNAVFLEHITAPYYYTQAVRIRLLELKFSSSKSEAEFFGEKMSLRFATVFSGVKADFVSFVPMNNSDQKERGYNQSELLAQSVARHLFLPCLSVIDKTRQTASQHNLMQNDRLENLKNVFEVPDPSLVLNKTIIFCDDIKTTGTTLRRCCDVLFEAGAKDIYCLCAAITDFSINF